MDVYVDFVRKKGETLFVAPFPYKSDYSRNDEFHKVMRDDNVEQWFLIEKYMHSQS